MKLYNTLNRKVEEFTPIDAGKARIYSCGPTVYAHIHIGNLSAFIYADTLRRAMSVQGINVRHVMNFTDVDDKTIRRSRELYKDLEPGEALRKLTSEYSEVFLQDMRAIGNDVDSMEFIKATSSIEAMRQLIKELYDEGYAYTTDDGVYFSIEKYRASGKTYGQLTKLSAESTSNARIDNDEYEKDDIHDFALWKVKKPGEPFWEFELDKQDVSGRPGWHIECSAMSLAKLGQPFDIHTGGVDLIFPHHENEIAQSTAGNGTILANYFFHNEHLLVDGKKMSKSLNNFYTLQDIRKKGYDPLAFRLMVLQSHYRFQSNFSWENLESANNSLQHIRAWADMRFQTYKSSETDEYNEKAWNKMFENLGEDLRVPDALTYLYGAIKKTEELGADKDSISRFVEKIDAVLGLQLGDSSDINDAQKKQLVARQKARDNKDWATSDKIRDELQKQGVGVRDTDSGQIWFRL